MSVSMCSYWGETFQDLDFTDAFLLPDPPPLPPYIDSNGGGEVDFSLDAFLSQPNYLLDFQGKEEPVFFQTPSFDNSDFKRQRRSCINTSSCCSCSTLPSATEITVPQYLNFDQKKEQQQEEEKKREEGRVSAQSVAARERRRKIAEKTQELGSLVPGGSEMNTAQMLQEAFKYVKFLQTQVRILRMASSMEGERGAVELGAMLSSWSVQGKLFAEEKCVVPMGLVESMAKEEEEEEEMRLMLHEFTPNIKQVDTTLS